MARPLQALIALARTDWAAARERARHDPVAGNRAQFLAWVAHFAPPADAAAIALESLAEAAKMDNLYWSVAICAWPLRALLERGLRKETGFALGPVLGRAEKLEHPVNRLDALELLLSAVFDDQAARRRVLHHLLSACATAKSWKASRALQRTAVLLGQNDAAESARVLALLPDGKYRRRAERELAAGGYGPRNFFW